MTDFTVDVSKDLAQLVNCNHSNISTATEQTHFAIWQIPTCVFVSVNSHRNAVVAFETSVLLRELTRIERIYLSNTTLFDGRGM